MSSPTDHAADYLAAKTAVAEHRRTQAAAEIAYQHDRNNTTRDALAKAVADVKWCRALVVACGEAAKGTTLDEALASHGPRPTMPEGL